VYVHRWDPAIPHVPGGPGWQVVRVPAAGGDAVVERRAGPLARAGTAAGWRWYLQGRRLVASRAAPADPWTHPVVAGAAVHVVPSPDGTRLALVHHHDVHVATVPGGPGAGDSLAVELASLTRLSREGGRDPEWRGPATLAYTSADRYVTHRLDAGAADTVAVGLLLPRDGGRGTVAFTGARIVAGTPAPDGAGPFQVIERGTLVVRGRRITCVGACDTGAADRVIDASGTTIIPGLVDVHAHHLAEDGPDPIPLRRPTSARYLAWGVTTVHDPAADLDQSFAVTELIEAGRLVGPRSFSTGVPLTCSDFDDLRDVVTRRDAAEHVARAQRLGAISIKDYKQCTRVQRQMFQDVGRERGITVTSEGSDPVYLLGLVMDGAAGWEHPIQYHPMYGDMIRFLGAAGVHYSAQLILSDYPHGNALEYWLGQEDLWSNPRVLAWTPWQEVAARRSFVRKPLEEFVFPVLARDAAALRRAGGRLPVGAHGEVDGLGTHWELWSYGMALSPLEALEAASLDGARFLGLERELGSLLPGKLADLVLVNGNPLADLRATADVRMVMKAGRLYDAATLDEVWPDPRPYGPRDWTPEPMRRTDVRPDDHWDRPPPAGGGRPGLSSPPRSPR
jgi:hypothetical protein